MKMQQFLVAGCGVLIGSSALAAPRLAESPAAITVLDDSQLAATPVNIGDFMSELPGIAGSSETAAVFADRVRLNFDTSFTGKDRLRVRLGVKRTVLRPRRPVEPQQWT